MDFAGKILYIYVEICNNKKQINRKELSEALNCSARTVNNCINSINMFLSDYYDSTHAIEYDESIKSYIYRK